MTKNSVELSASWQKVLLGFVSAKIPLNGITFLEGEFDSWDRKEAKSILEFGHFGESNIDHRDSRNLFRALNFLTAVQVKSVDARYAGTKENIKKVFSTGGAGNSDLIKKVKDIFDAIAASKEVAAQSKIVIQKDKVRLTVQPQSVINPPMNTTARFFDAAAKEVLKSKLLGAIQHVRENVRSSNRELVGSSFNNNAAIAVAWLAAKTDIQGFINQNSQWLLFNYTTMSDAISKAYTNFNDTVAKDSEKTSARLKLIAAVLEALTAAAPPLSVIGKLASTAIGQLKPDNFNPHTNYETLKGKGQPFFVQLFAQKLEQYENLRTLADLSKLSKDTEILQIAQQLSTDTLKLMQYVNKNVLDDIFGSGGVDSNNKLEAHKQAYLNQCGPIVRGQVKHQNLFMDTVVLAYANDVKKAIEVNYGWKKVAIHTDDMRIAIEMFLYSEYVVDVFDKKSGATRLFSENMINFFSQKGNWGILMLSASHEESISQGRLNWKGGSDHKRALVIFCRWYLNNINPFAMITGIQYNGRPYSAELIVKLCKAQVDIINKAISSGRSLTTFGGINIKSSWNWVRIDNAYKSLCGQDNDDWDMAE